MALVEAPPRERDQDEAERDVDPEDPLPGKTGDDSAADERADRDREAADPAPRAQGEPTLLGGHRRREERQRQRSDDRAADALGRARGDERVDRRGERGGGRGRREDPEPDHEHAPPAEAVAERGAGQEKHRKGQRVGVHGPLEPLDPGTEVLADHGQRGRDDEVVEGDHHQRKRGDDECPDGAGHLLLLASDRLLTSVGKKISGQSSRSQKASTFFAHTSSESSRSMEATTLISIPRAKNCDSASSSTPDAC